MPEKRKHFLINKPLQLRLMSYVLLTLLIVSAGILFNLYFGIWGSVLEAFSNQEILNDLVTAARLSQYEEARLPANESVAGLPRQPAPSETISPLLPFLKQTGKLTQRQHEIFKNILDQANRKLILPFSLLLIFIGWGSVFLTHKIAGPLYRFRESLKELEKGNLSIRITLRKYDEAKFVAAQFNQALENLEAIVVRIKKIIRDNAADPAQALALIAKEISKIKTREDRK